MRTLFEQPRCGLASPWLLLLALAVVHTLTAGSAQESSADDSNRPRNNSVYAKIILPMKPPAEGEHPAVESWIARRLRKRGKTELRAVTTWVRIAENGEEATDLWNATVEGKHWGCPVSGRVVERRADGKAKVSLMGWAPFPMKVKGATLPAETGSRRLAVVGRDDAFVALVVGPPLGEIERDDAAFAACLDAERTEMKHISMRFILPVFWATLALVGQSQVAFSQQPMSKGSWSYKNGKPETVNFDYGTELTAKDIERLSAFDSIAHRYMGFAGVDSEYVTIEGELLKLGRLKNLEVVYLNKDGIVDDDLKFIAQLPRIRELEFSAANGEGGCTDRCADYPSSAKALRELRIYNGQFTDKFIDKITKEMPNLEQLMLNSPELTDESLRFIAERCKTLKSLSIESKHFTAEGIKHLDKLPNLKNRGVRSPALRKRINQKEIPKLLGTWEYVSATYEGRPIDVGKNETITLTEDSWTLRRNGKLISSSTWEIDSTRSPKWLTQFTRGGKVNFLDRWVYKFDEAQLVLCKSSWMDERRPNRFVSVEGDKQYLIVLRRKDTKGKTE